MYEATVIRYFRNQARAKLLCGEELDDGRSIRSGLAMLDAAEYVQTLHPDNAQLTRLKRVAFPGEDGGVGDAVSGLIRRWHFNDAIGTPSDLLDKLVLAAERDWYGSPSRRH
jgi:hypothetical protein